MKVFSVEKWKESLDDKEIIKSSLESGWPQKCEGLTRKEMYQLGYLSRDNWMVENDTI